MKSMKPLQLTLAILKPHVIVNPVAVKDIRDIILKAEFKIVKSAKKHMTQEDAEMFYREHKDKFFYNRLVTFMSSGPIETYILARDNAIQEWRKLMGPTKVFKTQYAEPDTIRGKYGLSDTRNATHGSDSEESVRKEIEIFFPDFNIQKWYDHEEPIFRNDGEVTLDVDSFIHTTKHTKHDSK